MKRQVKITISELRQLLDKGYNLEAVVTKLEIRSDLLEKSMHNFENNVCIFCGSVKSVENYWSNDCPGYTLENLIKTEAHALGHTLEDVLTKCKKDEYVKLRRHIVKKATEAGWKLTEIAKAMNLDHSTVWYILHKQKDF